MRGGGGLSRTSDDGDILHNINVYTGVDERYY